MARFMHAHGVDCGIEGCADGRETLGYFSGDGRRRTASGHGPTLPNPEGGDTWFHGTRFGMDDEGMHGGGDYDHDDYHDDYTQDEKEGWGGGKVTGPERSAYEIGENADKHWNTDLGAHFTSLKPVARSFAGGGGLHGMTSTPSMGRVLHAGLHMSNPAVFTDEREMGAHAAKWAHKEGYRFHSPYGNAKEPVNEDHYDELRHGNYWHEGEDGELPYEHLGNYSGAHPEPAVDIDKHGVQPRHTQEHLDEYLANHPNREEITTGWKNHLKRQGHDGILYGNTLEGPHGHACAITLDDSTIHHRKWEWLNEHDRHEYDYQHGETYKPSTSGAGQWDKEWHSRDGRKPYTGSRRRVAALSPKPEYDSSLGYQENRRRESEWNTSVRRGLSLGHHTDDEARAAGYWGTGHDSDGWKPLPKDLYHVTTDVAGVHATGLKSRDELSQQHGKGLGGGESDTISFTDDPKVAEGIHDALHEFHGALNGKKTIAQMYDEAERGVGADTPYHSYFTASYPGGKDDPRLKAHIQGKEFEFGVRHESDVPHGWKPAEGHKVGDAADLQGLHIGWVRPATEDEQLRRRAACYKHYAFGRAMSGGKDDPLFFDTDLKSFAHSDPKSFGVIKAHPKPGAQGYQLGSLGEWRTATGDAVDVDKSYNHKTAIHEHIIDPFEPTERLFAPTKDRLDETLFDEQERMRPEVRKEILKVTDHFFDTHGYTGHERWARVFLAGSQASYWGGNHDFDLLIGINYPIFRQAHPELDHLSDVEVDRRFNEQLRDDFNMDGWRPSFDPHGEPWDRTGYVNHASYNIADIKPYAAYNVTDDVWAVRPIKEPEGHEFVTTEWYYFEGVASQILAAMRLQEPARTQTLRHIWDWVHGDRSRSFGADGTGAFDRGNALEKYLSQYPAPGHPDGVYLMDLLRDAKYGLQATASSLDENYSFKVNHYKVNNPDVAWNGMPRIEVQIHHGGKTVGSVGAHQRFDENGSTFIVSHVYVDPNHQRRGLATAMYGELHNQWPGIPVVHSEHRSDDARALTPHLQNTFGPNLHLGADLHSKRIAGLNDDDWRMEHRPPDSDGIPLHDMTVNLPDDVYTHPHYYADMNDPSTQDSVSVMRRVRGKPDAKVKIYRALPAEHAHKGINPGDWVTTSKEYARIHGRQSDPKHDWPVISATVRAGDLHTDGDDFREYGYNGDKSMPGNIAHKGGYHQEVSKKADGTISPVVRRSQSPVKGYDVRHDPQEFDDFIAGRGGVTARDSQGNYAGHMRWDEDGVFSQNVHEDHQHVADHLIRKMRQQLPKIHRQAALSGNDWEISRKRVPTGGSKFGERYELSAMDSDGKRQGWVRYHEPKRKGSPMHVEEVRGDVPGVASHLLNHMESLHPNASRTVFLGDNIKRDKNTPKHTTGDHGKPTDWDQHYDSIGELHRGFVIRMDPYDARKVNSADRAPEDHVKTLLSQIGGGRAGTHWTSGLRESQNFSQRNQSDPRTDIPVILHAQKPERKDIETRPSELFRHGVFPYDHVEKEVPIRKGRDVVLTGMSWKPDVAHPEADEQGWLHHTFDQPITKRAHSDGPSTVEDDPARWGVGGWRDRDMSQSKLRETHTGSDGYTYHHAPGSLNGDDEGYGSIYVTHGDDPHNVVGESYYGPHSSLPERLELASRVAPDHRRRGVATGMYDFAERLTGKQTAPADSHSDQAAAFWSHRRASRGSVTINYLHNTERAPHPGDTYGQDIEPHGRYLIEGYQGRTASAGDVQYISHQELRNMYSGDYDAPMGKAHGSMLRDWRDYKNGELDEGDIHSGELEHGGPTAHIRHLQEDIAQNGLKDPLVIRGGNVVVDGNHRGVAALNLRLDKIPVRHVAGLQQKSARLVLSATDDEWRMQHRPPGAEDGIPLHDMTHNLPDDVYTHPHYYADMSEPSVQDSVSVMRRVRGRPDAKVKIYRALPAEHAHKGIGPGDWVTTSREYARIHGRQADPKHDWPIISASVRAGDLHTDGDDFREYGYNGEHRLSGNVSYKGGYHQEVSQRADGTIKPVVRKAQSPVKDYTITHDPHSYEDFLSARGGVTIKDPKGNYAGHMRWDRDGVYSQDVHEDHQHLAEHLIRKMKRQVPKGIPSEITKKEASMAGTSTYPYDLRVAMPWFNNDDGVDPSKAKSVRDAGYAGYVGDSERDEELGHGGYGGHEDEFDDDLWDHVAPHPTHEEKRHMDEHGEYPDSYHERHDEAYGEAQHRKAQEDEMDHDDPDLHHFIGEHGSNSALWKEKGTFGKVNIKDQPVYATQSHVNQQHIDHYTASPGDISHSMRNTPGYGQRHAQDPYLADEHPMFVTHEGRLHVTDGHHRVAAALQSGQKHIMGWHYDGDKHGFPDEDEGGWGHHTSSRVQRRPELLSLSAYAKLVLVAEDEETHTREGVTHAGLIVKANDTGRVVVLQRSYKDEEDPARGMLEFPGGGIEPGESAYQAACREWQEETGAHLPEGDPSGSFISNGLYKGFIMVVPSEDDVDIHEAAVHSNPDDPFRLDPEVVMWIDIEHLADGPATRSEVKSGTDWDMLREAAL